MKKVLFVLSTILMLTVIIVGATLSISAEDVILSGTWGKLEWNLNQTTGELTISGEGEMDPFEPYSRAAWKSAYRSIKSVTVKTGVTSVSEYAFEDCTYLTKVTIEEGVTSIGELAFDKCSNLTNVSIPNSLQMIVNAGFQNSTKLICRTYENGKYIGNSENPYLMLMGVASSSLKTSIETLTIHQDTKIIYHAALSGCTKLKNVTVPDGLVCIGTLAFSGCSALTNITIPDNITYVGDRAFLNCDALTYNPYDNVNYLGNSENPYLVLIGATSTAITEVTVPKNTKIRFFTKSGVCINHERSIYSTIHLTMSLWQRDIRQSPAEFPLRVHPAGSPAYHAAYSLSSGFRGIKAHTPEFMKSQKSYMLLLFPAAVV